MSEIVPVSENPARGEIVRPVEQLPDILLRSLERQYLESLNLRTSLLQAPLGGDIQAQSRFYQITEMKYGLEWERGAALQGMQYVISSLLGGAYNLVYLVRGGQAGVRLYMGIRQSPRTSARISAGRQIEALGRSLSSNFPGIQVSPKPIGFADLRQDVFSTLGDTPCLAAMTGIPSLRGNKEYSMLPLSQSIDRLVDALQGEEYAFMVVAEPIEDAQLTEMIRRLRLLSQEVHQVVRQSAAFSQGRSDSTFNSQGISFSVGANLLPMLTQIIGGGINVGVSENKGGSVGFTVNETLTRDRLDKTAEYCEQVLDHYIQRLQRGRGLGFWNAGVFLLSESENTLYRLQTIARSLFSGETTHFEPMRMLDASESSLAYEALFDMTLPVLNPAGGASHPLGETFQKLATPISTDELSVLVSLPAREVPGMKVSSTVDFNLNPPQLQGTELGSLLYRGQRLPTRITITPKSLSRHTFVTGLTGSGKTNTCLALLKNVYKDQGLPFMVIDPAKTEYRFLLDSPELAENLMVFTLGDETVSPFRLNPFDFEPGFPLLTHIDLLKAVFNSAFPMYASMPYILEQAILEVYEERGWSLSDSTNKYLKDKEDYTPYLPKLSDLYLKIDQVVQQKRYGQQLTQDISAALKARISSLLVASKGVMLDTQRSISIRDLLARPVVLELRRIGDEDEKAFLMALLFVRLFQACQQGGITTDLRHVLLVEEAHRLLRNVPGVASSETANPRGKAVEMFTDMMAEMRAYGEGFIIVDQMPGKLVPDVIKGSNIKILHRLMAQDDRLAVGNAMGLRPEQVEYLPQLTVGQAVIHNEELGEACLVKVDSVEDELIGKAPDGETQAEREIRHNQHAEHLAGLMCTKSSDYYHLHMDIKRKYPSCVHCDAPCTYHKKDLLPTESLTRLGMQWVEAALLGSAAFIQKSHQRLQHGLLVYLNLDPGQVVKPGEARCLRVLLAVETVRRFSILIGAGGKWSALVDMETQLAEFWEDASLNTKDVLPFRRLVLSQITRLPVQARIGCETCPRRCWFGIVFQREKQSLIVEKFKEQLAKAKPGERISLPRLSDAVSNAFDQRFDPAFIPYVVYCAVAQATDSEIYLNEVRRQILSQGK